jgi:glycerol dehydrogenase-like iron-containing ADH family enzyme
MIADGGSGAGGGATDAVGGTPDLVFGRGVLAAAVSTLPRPYALVTQAEPLESAPPALVGGAAHVAVVSSLEERVLDRLSSEVPEVGGVLGLGGGMAMDSAKFLAWRRGVSLFEAPSAVSVDACVTNTIAVRAGGRVEYRGFVVADRVFVDFDLIGTAPVQMNRAGVGDLLSIHTALWDWRRGARHGHVQLVPSLVTRAEAVLDRIEALGEELRDVSDRAVEVIVRAYLEINDMAIDLGHAQVEEGSEHYFVYCLEQVAGRSFIHGEIVTLGAVLMSYLQGRRTERPIRIAQLAGVRWRPGELGISGEELAATLRRLPSFVREASLPYSVINETSFDDVLIRELEELTS